MNNQSKISAAPSGVTGAGTPPPVTSPEEGDGRLYEDEDSDVIPASHDLTTINEEDEDDAHSPVVPARRPGAFTVIFDDDDGARLAQVAKEPDEFDDKENLYKTTSSSGQELATTEAAALPQLDGTAPPQLYHRPELAEATWGLHPVMASKPYKRTVIMTNNVLRMDNCCDDCHHLLHHKGVHRVFSMPPELRRVTPESTCQYGYFHAGECDKIFNSRVWSCGMCGECSILLADGDCCLDDHVVCDKCGWRCQGVKRSQYDAMIAQDKAAGVINPEEDVYDAGLADDDRTFYGDDDDTVEDDESAAMDESFADDA